MAANHWQTAIDVHQANFPDASHDCADISQADPRRYPRTDVLLASPECTNHSQARGISRKKQNTMLWDAPDPSAERSRATMWDVIRFAEQMRYDAMVVENVVEATKWILWPAWVKALTDLGYQHRVLSHNSMHHGVPQSRDRIYIACWREGLQPDLELETNAWCSRCDAITVARQGWKPGRSIGRYRQQWRWHCVICNNASEPLCEPAASIIDWSLPCPRIGERRTKNGKLKPLAPATRARILAGLQRYGWAPIVTAGAGNVYESTPGNRARPITDPLPTQTTTSGTALATPGFLFQTAHGGRIHDLGDPHPTVCAEDDRLSLIVPLRQNGEARAIDEPIPTVAAMGNHHALLMANTTNNQPHSVAEPMTTIVAGTQRHALIMRNNKALGDQGQMVTPAVEPIRTVTTKGHQSLLVPYNRTGRAQHVDEPASTVTTRDRFALVDMDAIVDDCGFRMLEPHEIAAAMAFPDGYIPLDLSKKDRVKLAGNAVTPPVMAWITGRLIQALEATS